MYYNTTVASLAQKLGVFFRVEPLAVEILSHMQSLDNCRKLQPLDRKLVLTKENMVQSSWSSCKNGTKTAN